MSFLRFILTLTLVSLCLQSTTTSVRAFSLPSLAAAIKEVNDYIDQNNIETIFNMHNNENSTVVKEVDDATEAAAVISTTDDSETLVRKELAVGQYGLDTDDLITGASWSCLRQAGFKNAAVRVFTSGCFVDLTGVISAKNAANSGYGPVDVVLVPSLNCTLTPAQQVDAALAALGQTPFGSLWIEVGNINSHWLPSPDANALWLFGAVLRSLERVGWSRVGILSSYEGWGNTLRWHSEFFFLKLWYVHHDGDASFKDFVPFGGWKMPLVKQFIGPTRRCNVKVNLDAII